MNQQFLDPTDLPPLPGIDETVPSSSEAGNGMIDQYEGDEDELGAMIILDTPVIALDPMSVVHNETPPIRDGLAGRR